MKKLRHAVIGTGGISPKHFQGYLNTPGVEVVAACDIDGERLRRACETFGVGFATADYREILAREDIDSVSICLPNHLHAPVSIEAMRAGKHVHCEKPMALNAEQAAGMLSVSRETGKTLMVALNNRFTPFAQYAKGLAEDGWFGEIYFAKCGWQRRAGLPYTGWFAEKALSGGGALIDLGVHFIDLALHMMGFPEPRSVFARTYCKFGGTDAMPLYAYQQRPIAPGMKYDVEDLAAGMIDLSNGASALFEISWASNIEAEQFFLELYGDKAGMRFLCRVDGQSAPQLKLFGRMNGQLADYEPIVNPNAYSITEFSHFADCALGGRTPTIAPPEQGVLMMRIIDAVYRSEAQRSQVML